MKKYLLGLITAIVCSLILTFGLAIKSHNDLELLRSNSSWFGEYKPLPNCHVQVSNARLDLIESGFADKKFVTADVFAQCDKLQKNAQVTLEIWKEGSLFAHRVVRIQNDPTDKKLVEEIFSSSTWVVGAKIPELALTTWSPRSVRR